MTTQSAHFAMFVIDCRVVDGPRRGERVRLVSCTTGRLSSATTSFTMPTPLRSAARRRGWSRRPFRSRLRRSRASFELPCARSRESPGSAPQPTARRRAAARRRRTVANAPSPMSSTTIVPQTSRFTTWPRLIVAKVSVRSARTTSPVAAPVDASSPTGTSIATMVAPRARIAFAASNGDGNLAARRAARAGAEQPVDDDVARRRSCPDVAGVIAPSDVVARARVRRCASGVFAATGSTTRTRTPVAASARATTHASPPLLPGPARTSTPRSRRSR